MDFWFGFLANHPIVHSAVGELAGGGSEALGVGDRGQVTGDMWHVIRDT